jgi:hypothetical protein
MKAKNANAARAAHDTMSATTRVPSTRSLRFRR